MTSKLAGNELNISARTVDIHRARLLRKYGARATPKPIAQLPT
ncbi:LuxR C-terminal-related transcriptional regulator [Caballeronia hypogeia]